MSNLIDYATTLAKLTTNAVKTLAYTKMRPEALQSGKDVYLSGTHTGPGKYTHIAMLGVRNNLRKAGCIESAEDGKLDRLTPLGIDLSQAIASDLPGALTMCRESTAQCRS